MPAVMSDVINKFLIQFFQSYVQNLTIKVDILYEADNISDPFDMLFKMILKSYVFQASFSVDYHLIKLVIICQLLLSEPDHGL